MSEHVLIFGNGYYVPDRLRTWARTTGQTVSCSVLCDPDQMTKIDEPEKLARIVVLPAGATLEEWVAFARLVHELHPVTRIGTFSDQGQVPAATAGQALGIPTHSVETVRLVHDKYAMRQRLAEAGVESTASAVVHDVAGLTEFAASHGYPCVVKPASGMASAGVSVISGPDEIEAAMARARGITRDQGAAPTLITMPVLAADRATADPAADDPAAGTDPPIQVIVEKFLPGVQYSVECFSEQGEHQVVTITRKYSDPVSLVELGHVMPAPLEPAEQEAIGEHVSRALDALGVEFGPTHTEIVLTEAGPRIIETHLRFGGDHIWDLVTDATGVDLVKNQWRQMIGEKVLPGIRATLQDEDRPTRCQAIWFASTQASGVLVEIAGLDGPHPEGVTVKYPLPAGTELHGLQSSYSRLAQARASAETAEEAVALARQAIERLEVVVRVPSTVPEVV
ncbi:ATP-grasp domain-containing protein [Jatrophihabitans sp.]|uniref:ATP-grasp domain-containing protein n=1 Tax=Jatrophihabitans sp. TaxID=1932789 RepID=UPI002C145778|nr:ATP-grasp domain-containing protein [Jatrophihabitans sp.]